MKTTDWKDLLKRCFTVKYLTSFKVWGFIQIRDMTRAKA